MLNMKRIDFTLKDYLENPDRRVETRNGKEAEIFVNKGKDDYVAYIDGEGYFDYYDNGKRSMWGVNNESEYDLFIVTEDRKFNVGDNFTYKGQGFKVKGLSEWGYKVEVLKPYTTKDTDILHTVEISFACENEMTEYQAPVLTPMERAVYDIYDKCGVLMLNYREKARELMQLAEMEIVPKMRADFGKNNQECIQMAYENGYNDGKRVAEQESRETTDEQLAEKYNEGYHDALKTLSKTLETEGNDLYGFIYGKGLEDGKKEEYGRGYVEGYKDCMDDKEQKVDGKKKVPGWICVDSNDNLRFIISEKPPVMEELIPEEILQYLKESNGTSIILDRALYPDMKHEDHPKKVELDINEIPGFWDEKKDEV